PVVIRQRSMRKRSCGRIRETERIAFQREFPIPLIEKQQGSRGTDHEKILKSLVFEIREKRASSAIQNTDASGFCDIFESAIASIAIEPVRQARRLAYVQIVESIVVVIPG